MSVIINSSQEYIKRVLSGECGWPSREILETVAKLARREGLLEAEKICGDVSKEGKLYEGDYCKLRIRGQIEELERSIING